MIIVVAFTKRLTWYWNGLNIAVILSSSSGAGIKQAAWSSEKTVVKSSTLVRAIEGVMGAANKSTSCEGEVNYLF